jgi:hypothetical protein
MDEGAKVVAEDVRVGSGCVDRCVLSARPFSGLVTLQGWVLQLFKPQNKACLFMRSRWLSCEPSVKAALRLG